MADSRLGHHVTLVEELLDSKRDCEEENARELLVPIAQVLALLAAGAAYRASGTPLVTLDLAQAAGLTGGLTSLWGLLMQDKRRVSTP